MIRDLETLRLTIPDDASREFITEALKCYSAGAYRAAAVMAVAAGMDDLRRKLGGLVATKAGAIDPSITAGQAAVDKLFQDQQAFEAQLIDLAEKATVMSPADAAKLRLLLKTRHLCAHPSGHAGSAEEARECIASMIDLVLARPPLMGMAAVTQLLERLKGPHFFPSGDPAKTDAVTLGELNLLMVGASNALAVKLSEQIRLAAQAHAAAQAAAKPLAVVLRTAQHENCMLFARGMLHGPAQHRAAVWSYLGHIVEEAAGVDESLFLLACDPAGLALAKPLTRERAVALVRRHLARPDARVAMKGWRQAGLLSKEEIEEMAQQAATLFVNSSPHKHEAAIRELEWPGLEVAWRDALVAASASGTWDVANPAIDAVQGFKPEDAAKFSIEQVAEYLLGVARNAQGGYSPYSARPLLVTGLGPREPFIDSLIEFIAKKPDTARASKTDWEALVRILLASNRPDAVHPVLDLFASGVEVPHSARPMLERLAEGGDPALKVKADAIRAKLPKPFPA